MYLLKVKDIMVSDLITGTRETKVSEIIDTMHRENIGSVIITEGDRPVNIITKGDILVALRNDYLNRTVGELLSLLGKEKLIVAKEDALITEIINIFEEHNIKHIPITDNSGRLVGIVASADIIRNVPQLIFLDPLTGLANRRFLNLIETKLSGRRKRGIWVLMVDIDNFKRVNDTYGHLAGDRVLKEIGKCLSASVRTHDEVIRYGGEEFLIILYRTDREGAKAVGEKIRRNIENLKLGEIPDLKITVSVGIAEFRGDLKEAIEVSDKALYEAKREGKNRVSFAD